MIKYRNYKSFNGLGSYGICPRCGGQMIQTDLADNCTECEHYEWYGS